MAWLDRLRVWRAVASLAVWLCALHGTSASANPASAHEARSAPAVSIVGKPSMPMASDRMPCAMCFMAPIPATQGFGGECGEPEEAGWPLRAPCEVPVSVRFDSGGGFPRLPLCIVYCRWRD